MKRAKAAPLSVGKRPLGPRAVITRDKLLQATAAMLETGGLLDFKVVDVARAVGTSPATFYQYFASVEDAILELSAKIADDLTALLDVINKPWKGSKSLDNARQFVDEYFRHYDEHGAILRVRNLSAQEGDIRFRKVRNDAMLPFTKALAAKIEESQGAGRVVREINAFAGGGGLMAMMERLAAFRYEFEARGVDRDSLVETTARMVHQTVTGRR